MRTLTILLTHLEHDILEILWNRPMSSADLRRELALCEAEDIRPSTVSGLLLGLLNSGLLAETGDGQLTVTRAGRTTLVQPNPLSTER